MDDPTRPNSFPPPPDRQQSLRPPFQEADDHQEPDHLGAGGRPARPASPEPSPNASMSTRRTAMPMQPAMVRFCVTARMLRPSGVSCINPQVSTNVTIAKAMANMRFQVKMKSPIT